ncbi:alpha,alpha-phosphotrehalase [Vagococcus sp. DIV0080]|uniref:Alpha,alpha-phosphotrehalase n=1 Tax=Candidatus Vagococcus giribetii TaxID=2230876 RepID=A0ABS3HSF2_9ENTE|nr:alpha,alpha-phosphotrehalase [Vagococcus sp. DIV0080]MBO0476576.1 alpha,alpha-phosphotrehalase [Vagococcus sp. DIV0080]
MTFKNKVIYQIYPKSFLDTTGNGIGDLAGIIQKLPYLSQLGVDMLWLNPIYPSPQKDNGYDISNYLEVDSLFGGMGELERLIKEAKKHQIDIMFDMVLNHVSTEHEWFQKALAGDKKYQDYFILRDEPTDWVSKFGGNAWSKFGETDQYYLHLFDKTQADLNWRNEEVREELVTVVNFWLEKGIRGLRFDVINVIGKDEVLQNNEHNDGKAEYTDKPITHDYLKELSRNSFGKYDDTITVGEMSSTTIENCVLYTQPERNELSMTFNFHHLKVDYANKEKWTIADFDFEELKELFHSWGETMSEQNGWNALFWNNHDQPRALNRFVDVKHFRETGAKMLAASIHLSRGTPFIYMGEEIGMVNPEFDSIDQYVDVESLNAFNELLETGKTEAEVLNIIKEKSRDNSRTPMQWNGDCYSGFSTGTPWLQVADNYSEINVEKELTEGSIFSFYQELIRLRKTMPLIAEGTYKGFEKKHSQVYGFIRTYQEQELLCLNNFYSEPTSIMIPDDFLEGTILVDNYSNTVLAKEQVLQPYQTLAILV